jgi:hypothetical protein
VLCKNYVGHIYFGTFCLPIFFAQFHIIIYRKQNQMCEYNSVKLKLNNFLVSYRNWSNIVSTFNVALPRFLILFWRVRECTGNRHWMFVFDWGLSFINFYPTLTANLAGWVALFYPFHKVDLSGVGRGRIQTFISGMHWNLIFSSAVYLAVWMT